MALYMFFHVMPDEHIEFLSQHADLFRPYMEGCEPEFKPSLFDKLFGRDVEVALPEDWPQSELEGYCPEVNHRQIKLFHYLLNGTDDKVGHAGCVFQTWFSPRHRSIAIPIDGENFAITSTAVLELKELIERISEEELIKRYKESSGEDSIDAEGKEFIAQAFNEISGACDEAIAKAQGLMWTAG